MRYIQNKLGRQLILILVIVFDIILITAGVLLPNVLKPIYEDNIYNFLKSPLGIVGENLEGNNINSEMTYIFEKENRIYTSDNYNEIVELDPLVFKDKLTGTYGNFSYNNNTYYYYSMMDEDVFKVTITNKTYLNKMGSTFMVPIISIFLISFILISFIVFLWSAIVVRKIAQLKNKIDNIENDNFNHNLNFKTDDEIKVLAKSIEDMRLSLKEQEAYKNTMYQNISHDFKTPLTVIKSYVEAVEDGVEEKGVALGIIKEQADKLEKKVYSLLYLNKLDYLKDQDNGNACIIDIKKVIDHSVDKFKYQRKDIKFSTSVDNSKFLGDFELWETILDNILSNFIRYAEKEINITVKNNRMILYNDGPNIDEKVADDLFNPFRKGLKGQFGLGLSIVKKTLNLLNYDISIKNDKKGVSFIITKR